MRMLKRKSTALCDLSLYSDYLLLAPKNRGCTHLASSMEKISHDSVRNFLVREDYTPKDLFDRVSSLVDLLGGILSVDDSIWDKPYSNARLNSLIGRHYSGKHKKVVQGICLVTLFYTSTSGQRYPVNYRVYEQGGAQTKNELFREMLTEVLSWGLCPSVVSGDSWYSSKDNLRWIRRQGLDAFCAVEKDRIISINKGEHQQIQQASITTEGLWTHLKGFDFVTAFKKEQANQTRYYIYYKYVPDNENDTIQAKKQKQKATEEEFQKVQKGHWNIEEFHRAEKQLCNAENFLVRIRKAVQNHIFAVYWAFTSLEEAVNKGNIDNWYQFRNIVQRKMIRQYLT